MPSEAIIIPVEFDTSKGLSQIAAGTRQIKSLAGEADKLKGSFSGVGSAIGRAFSGFAGGALFGAVTTLLAGFAEKLFTAKKKIDEYGEAVKKATEQTGAEIFKINALVSVAKDETASREARINAISQLQKQYPDYLRNISLETINSVAATKAINNLTKSLFAKATAQAFASRYAEKEVEQYEAQKKLIEANAKLTALQKKDKDFLGFTETKITNQQVRVDNLARSLQELNRELIELRIEGEKAFKESLDFTKQEKPTVIKTPEIKLKPTVINLDFVGKMPLHVRELEIDADEVALKKTIDSLPKIKERNTPDTDGRVDLLNEKQNKFFLGTQENARVTAEIISSTLTPSFTGMFDAIRAGESPMKAFFNTLIDSVNQLISRLVAAAIQAAVLQAISGGTFGGNFLSVLGFGGGGVANRVGFIGGSIGGSLAVNVNGVLRGSDIHLSGRAGGVQLGMVR